ncbi:uncharacterized protein TRUGW13939_11787 [Talaromyces rugulosus]|uniref:Uncharacterized protein n=1 Tax=Talaromyces rugulosus TaxID=121627 RepID=A0A7H8RDP7_TALRU|nr:uncharacterized protein TRUGW13939_11787 [Talaromyces rugulosus]QKX64612.1 hypothetical protein TRUGW13939_11787 [Talaromyces rugulosus]
MAPVIVTPDLAGGYSDPVDILLDSDATGTPTAIEDVTKTLAARSTSSTTTTGVSSSKGEGTISPTSINMQGMLALFAILGAAFVVASIWFFFWAKNGGFIWRKGDWDDYKSTVLRRKGPDGRTLSNATKSTRLGGGTVRGYSDDGGTVTDMTETATTITNEKAPPRKKKFRETAKEKLLRKRKDEKWEGEADDDMRAYRREKAARVGGINADSDGTYYGTEYTPSSPPTASAYTESEAYDPHDRHPRRSQDHTRRDTRNVSGFSFTAGNEDVISQSTAEESLMGDARKSRRESRRPQQQSKDRQSRHNSPRKREAPRSSMPGGYTEPLDLSSHATNSAYQYSTVESEDDLGTRSYHHPIPGLTKGYRRDRDGGGRRRRDSLSDSE